MITVDRSLLALKSESQGRSLFSAMIAPNIGVEEPPIVAATNKILYDATISFAEKEHRLKNYLASQEIVVRFDGEYPKQLIIDRATWVFGCGPGHEHDDLGKGETRLKNSRGYCCCLGFACLQSDGDPAEINGIGLPNPKNVGKYDPFGLMGKFGSQSQLTDEAVNINDDNTFDEQIQREIKLAELFAQYGTEVIFVGVYT